MKELEKLSTQIRISSLKMVHKSGASHISSALSITDILSTLYGKVLNYDANNENLESRDRFILSKGHACVAVYAAFKRKLIANKKINVILPAGNMIIELGDDDNAFMSGPVSYLNSGLWDHAEYNETDH